MKASIKNFVRSLTPLIVLVLLQALIWADTSSEIEQSRWSIVSSKPELWIGVVLFTSLMVAGTMIGKKAILK